MADAMYISTETSQVPKRIDRFGSGVTYERKDTFRGSIEELSEYISSGYFSSNDLHWWLVTGNRIDHIGTSVSLLEPSEPFEESDSAFNYTEMLQPTDGETDRKYLVRMLRVLPGLIAEVKVEIEKAVQRLEHLKSVAGYVPDSEEVLSLRNEIAQSQTHLQFLRDKQQCIIKEVSLEVSLTTQAS